MPPPWGKGFFTFLRKYAPLYEKERNKTKNAPMETTTSLLEEKNVIVEFVESQHCFLQFGMVGLGKMPQEKSTQQREERIFFSVFILET